MDSATANALLVAYQGSAYNLERIADILETQTVLLKEISRKLGEDRRPNLTPVPREADHARSL